MVALGIASSVEMVAPPAARSLLGTRPIQGRHTEAWLASEGGDQQWDDFLRATPLGQFQQSSLWAQAKQTDGWKSLRVTLSQEERIVGGFQVLWRRTRFGRIGYISKGPVLPGEHLESLVFALDLLRGIVHSHRLVAIAVQPPDLSRQLPSCLKDRGFALNRLMDIVSATCCVPLAGAPGDWERKMTRSKKAEVRQAIRRGVTIREGGDADIPKFFELMASTCARQGTKPNPSSVEALQQLAGAFRGSGECRLSFAVCEGETVACVLDLKFGDRVTSWKKGWNGSHSDWHPNTLLTYQSLRWAESVGCRYLDFAGMNRQLAECVLARRPLTEEQMKARDAYNLHFGAEPRLLPLALIYWRNWLLRFIYVNAVGREGHRSGSREEAARS